VQRLRIRYAKRGPLRFASHRDFARALERAVLRAGLPIAYSQGFSPHPKISYASAAPTGVASEAEYVEIGLREVVDADATALALDRALPPGLDIIEAVSAGTGGLADRIDASAWRIELPGPTVDLVESAIAAFVAAPEIRVERRVKQGMRVFDARAAVVSMSVTPQRATAPSGAEAVSCAILDLVVRHVTPTVRPDDVLTGLRVVADLEPSAPPRVTRLVQGVLTAKGEIADPLAADRNPVGVGTSPGVSQTA
jgi:radical SAM-linked protein